MYWHFFHFFCNHRTYSFFSLSYRIEKHLVKNIVWRRRSKKFKLEGTFLFVFFSNWKERTIFFFHKSWHLTIINFSLSFRFKVYDSCLHGLDSFLWKILKSFFSLARSLLASVSFTTHLMNSFNVFLGLFLKNLPLTLKLPQKS